MGIFAETNAQVSIIGNIIWTCGSKAGGGAFYSSLIHAPASAVVQYNILWKDSMTKGGNQSIRDVNGGCQSFYDFNADPKFNDLANGDFTLASDSPCIDKGPPDAQYKDHDGSRNDIGMFGGHNFIPDGRTTNKPIVLGLDIAPIAVPTGGTVTIESTGATVK